MTLQPGPGAQLGPPLESRKVEYFLVGGIKEAGQLRGGWNVLEEFGAFLEEELALQSTSCQTIEMLQS